MNKSVFSKFGFWICLVLLTMLCCEQALVAQTRQRLRVPEDYPTPEAALEAADPGGIIILDTRDWFVNLNITKPITIRGRRNDRPRLLPADETLPTIQVRSASVNIRNLRFTEGIVGVEALSEAVGLTVSNCEFIDVFGDGIRCIGSRDVSILNTDTGSDLTSGGNFGNGFVFEGVDGFLVDGATASGNSGSGFDLNGSNGLVINCDAGQNIFAGYDIEGTDIAVVDCNAGLNRTGFLFSNCRRLAVEGNNMASNLGLGLLVTGVRRASFANNSIAANRAAEELGAIFTNTRNTSFVGNEISFDNVFYAPDTRRNFISGNMVQSAEIIDDGVNNFIEE